MRASAKTAPRESRRAVEMARAAHAGMLRPDAELMNLGVYASSPKLPIKVHDYGMSYKSIVQWIKLRTFLFFRGRALSPASRLPWIPRRAVLVVTQLVAGKKVVHAPRSSYSRNYLHSLLDDYMGLFAMMHFRNEVRCLATPVSHRLLSAPVSWQGLARGQALAAACAGPSRSCAVATHRGT